MSTVDWSIVSSVFGFLGSITLFIPGWRASVYLGHIEKVRKIAEENQASSNDPGFDLLNLMRQQQSGWSRFDHWALITGIFCLALSFAIELGSRLN